MCWFRECVTGEDIIPVCKCSLEEGTPAAAEQVHENSLSEDREATSWAWGNGDAVWGLHSEMEGICLCTGLGSELQKQILSFFLPSFCAWMPLQGPVCCTPLPRAPELSPQIFLVSTAYLSLAPWSTVTRVTCLGTTLHGPGGGVEHTAIGLGQAPWFCTLASLAQELFAHRFLWVLAGPWGTGAHSAQGPQADLGGQEPHP